MKFMNGWMDGWITSCNSNAWFPLFQEIEIQGLFKDLSMTSIYIFKDLPVYSYR